MKSIKYNHQDCADCFDLLTKVIYHAREEIGLYGKDFLIYRTILMAMFQDRPFYDLEALSEECKIPRTTIMRRVDALIEMGYIEREKAENGWVYRQTENAHNTHYKMAFRQIDMIREFAETLERKHQDAAA